MKIIFLNALNAEIRGPLTEFLLEHAADTDIFCFEEAAENMLELCREILPDHRSVTAHKKISKREYFHQAIFVKSDVRAELSSPMLENAPTGLGLYVEVSTGGKRYGISNVHGLALPGDKRDSPDRLIQTEGWIDFLRARQIPRIVGGDFNVSPDTQSILRFEEEGYRNLIKEFGITTTRNKLSWKRFPGHRLYYSDYVFTSPEVRVKTFSVPANEISDHLPMILETEI